MGAERTAPVKGRRLRRAITVLAWVVIAGNVAAIGVFAAYGRDMAELTSGGEPVQFYRTLSPLVSTEYGTMFGIAHNAGDSISTTVEALYHGADIIEVDVVIVGDRLFAAHHSPLRFIGKRFFRGPPLDQVWGAAAQSDVIKLDLKNKSDGFRQAVVEFLRSHRDHEVMIASRDAGTLEYFAAHVPTVLRFLSVPDEDRLQELANDDEIAGYLDGVTINHRLLSEESISTLHERQLVVFAWTVNDLERVGELAQLGVDGIITDNLAILELLKGTRKDEVGLRELVTR